MEPEPIPMMTIGNTESEYRAVKIEVAKLEREYLKLKIEMLKEEISERKARGRDNGTE